MELPTHVVPQTDPNKEDNTSGSNNAVINSLSTLTTEEIQLLCDPQISIADVTRQLQSNVDKGLRTAEATRRLELYGSNELEKKGQMPLVLLFLSQFVNLIIVILIIAAVVSIIVGEVVEGIAVIGIILITVCLSTGTEYSSGNALEALSQLTDPHTHVYRDGELQIIRTPEIVPGDIIELSPGDLVPADIRILQAHSAKVNEMILTGESADVSKKENASVSESSAKLTNVNMVYSSTSVVEGRIKGMVMLTGMNTRVGSIAALLSDADSGGGGGSSGVVGKDDENSALQSRHRQARQMSLSHEYEMPEVSDHGCYESDGGEDEESGFGGKHTSGGNGRPISYKSPSPPGLFTRLKKKVASYQDKKTPLQEGLHRLGMTMTIFAITGALLVVVIGIFRGYRDPNNNENAPWLQSILLAISMAVSAIPEGLPLVVTICLALGTTAMAKKNALIRRLPAVETLGSASVICSDKTGTLTSGKMTATKAWTLGKAYNISGEGYDPTRGTVTDATNKDVHIDSGSKYLALSATMNVANLCNEATVQCVEGRWKNLGTSTEAALVVGTEKFGLDTSDNRKSHRRVLNVPFSSTFKMMVTVQEVDASTDQFFYSGADSTTGAPLVVLAKGAPFSLLALCGSALTDGSENSIVPLTPELMSQIEAEVDTLSSTGLRVLAMCYKRISELPQEIQQDENSELSSEEKMKLCVHDMVFCGLIGMMDPPRKGVRQAVRRAKKGSVRTVMITGDYLKTAVAIAEMVDILEPSMDEGESAIDCSALRPDGIYLRAHEIDAITWHTFVFARAKPEDKLEIVKSFQRQGFVCAMTGDGVNDAPALRQANIGIAMGLTGSEVAKAASDMILTDDKFASIVEAVELGRTIYANLRKFVMYLIGTNWSQVLVILVSVLIGMPAPLEPLQILFINLITDSAPAIALSIEKAEANVMKERPRKRNAEILSGVIIMGIMWHAAGLVLFMLFSFFMGLWWETGYVLLAHMYEDDDLVDTCQRLNGNGVWETIHDPDCVKDGLKIARTMVFLTIVFSESLRPLTARSFSSSIHTDFFDNIYMIYAISFSFFCTFLIIFTPGLNDIFHVASPNWYEWLLVVVGVVLTIFSDEQMKNRLREENKKDGRWHKLFNKLADSSRELRNLRAHLADQRAEKKEHLK